MKRAIALLCCLLCICIVHGVFAAGNLVENGGFETFDASGVPLGWYEKAYRNQAGHSRLVVTDEKAHTGNYSVMIENASNNDARFVYTVQVKPESMYRLSGYVLVDSMEDTGNGANFGVENIYSFSKCLFDTNGEWQYLEWYGETGEDQKTLSFGVRVGGYSAESIGKAYFDDISLEQVEELPENVVASLWYDASSGAQQSTASKGKTENEKRTGLIITVGVLFLLLIAVVYPLLDRKGNRTAVSLVLLAVLTASLGLRVYLAFSVPGYQVDIGCFTAWSMRMASVGPASFYAPDYFCDYPPGAMLLLWPVGVLLHHADQSLRLFIVKLLPIVFDFLSAWVLYVFAKKRVGRTGACGLASFCLLMPAALVNGAAWGQIDSVLSFFIAVTAVFAMQQKWHFAIPLFVISALVKPQALLFAPIGGMLLIFCLCRLERKQLHEAWKNIAVGVAAALFSAALIIFPFSIGQDSRLGWLFTLYGETLSSYAYATLNTANLYYLIGANWRGLDQIVPVWFSITSSAVLMIGGLLLLYKKTCSYVCSERLGRRLGALLIAAGAVHSVLLLVGETYALYGYTMMVLVYVYAILCMSADRRTEVLPFYMALALIGVYVLGVKVHERYLFPALLLLLMSFASTRDKRVLWLFAGLTATTFINTSIVLDNAVLFGAENGHLNNDTYAVNIVLCTANLFLWGYSWFLGANGLRASKKRIDDKASAEKCEIPEGYRKMLLAPGGEKLHLRARDYLLMGVVTVLYSLLAFSNLGSTAAPQTAWVSTSPEEQIILDLGEEKEFCVLYYAGVSYNNFSLSTSADGIHWSEEYPCQMREGLCWQWKYAVSSSADDSGEIHFSANSPQNTLWFNGRYLRVNACESGLNLWEIVARDRSGKNLSLTLSSHTGAKTELLDQPRPAAHLIDETATFTGEPGWFNSMYFDEIYHAREAYHNLHGEITYEWTHPPLGKLLMAVGIKIFGMTPFGWRFAGALMGVLMLPALYLLALQLMRRRSAAFLAMSAFALDLMHFTQTRIATIDSFPLLFILLSYLCMVRYLQMDLFAVDDSQRLFSKAFIRSLVLLFAGGVFMGLSIASKWTGAYSAVGLAILFFSGVWRQIRASMFSFDLEAEGRLLNEAEKNRLINAQKYTLNRVLVTCCFCVAFYVLVPAAIYVISYIPQLAPAGPFTLERVIRTQQNMLNYHSTPGLGMDHPFQSPWWQWPFIMKPIWYVQDQYEPAGFASTIMCLGNPWVFYIGAFAMAGVLVAFTVKYACLRKNRIVLKGGNGDLTLYVLVIGFLAQYLPWMLVPRSMYIYHYFSSVPFIILATAWFVSRINSKRIRRIVIGLYIVGAVAFFVMFFPYASGTLTDIRWLDAMKWFSRLYY